MTESDQLKALKQLQSHPGWELLRDAQRLKEHRQEERILHDSTPETLIRDRAWLSGLQDWEETLENMLANLERQAKAERAKAKAM